MGRLFVIQNDLTPYTPILLCNACHTDIFPHETMAYYDKDSFSVEKPINVVVDTQEDYYLDHSLGIEIVAANVYCVACSTLLGYKIIKVHSLSDRWREGRVTLKLRKLLYWNCQQMLDAIAVLPPQP